MSTLITLFIILLEVLATAIKRGKQIIYTDKKEEMKLDLLVESVIVYIDVGNYKKREKES